MATLHRLCVFGFDLRHANFSTSLVFLQFHANFTMHDFCRIVIDVSIFFVYNMAIIVHCMLMLILIAYAIKFLFFCIYNFVFGQLRHFFIFCAKRILLGQEA